MKRKIEQAVALIRQNRTKRRRTAALLLALSCFVSANVFWALRDTGTALTDEALCGMKEHVHSAECYEAVPADAADPEAGIALDEDGNRICRLICGKEEHIHSAECVPAPAADVESPADWEATLPDSTADSLREQLARTAESQLGYTESERNFAVTNGERRNYSRYGQWYGSPYGNWNPLFVYFCLYYAGVPEDRIPGRGGCWAWSVKLAKEGLIRTAENGTPARGDILLLDQDSDGRTDRVGIVTLTQTAGEGLVITAAEGACGGTAAEMCYLWNDPCIAGFVSPEDPETLPALEYSVASESLITVHASAETDVFPAGTVMSVTDIAPEEAMQLAEETADETKQIQSAVAVDISFRDKEGNELEPADGQTVSVQIALPEDQQFSGNSRRLLHIRDDGTAETVSDAVFTENAVTFEAESFSIYLVTEDGPVHKDSILLPGSYGQIYPNSYDHPYVMNVGETITLIGEGSVDNGTEHYLYIDPANTYVRQVGTISPLPSDDPSVCRTTGQFQAIRPGKTNVVVDVGRNGNHDYQNFWIEAVPQIYVKTAMGETSKDEVHEYLPGVDLADGGVAYFFGPDIKMVYDSNGKPKYVMNADHSENTYYRIAFGDEIEVVSYAMKSDIDANHLDFSSSHWYILEKIGDTGYEPVDPAKPDDLIRITAKYRVNECYQWDREHQYIQFRDTKMYIWGEYSDKGLSHADIEIADGGTYRVETTIEDLDGTITTVITEYDAYVSDVNSCQVIGYDNNVIASFSSGDYFRNGEPGGGSQFELTSNYVRDPNGPFLINGERISIRGDSFALKDVNTTRFDVKLLLKPKTETVTKTRDGVQISQNSYSITDRQEMTVPSQVFEMNHQSVIDAFNKCPMRSGLDFTLKADVNSVSSLFLLNPYAKKIVENGVLEDNAYEFELLDWNDLRYAGHFNPDANAHVSSSDPAFAQIPNDAQADRAFQIIDRDQQHAYEYVWGADIDGDGLEAALNRDEYFRSQNLNRPDRIYWNWNSIPQDQKERFFALAKQYVTGEGSSIEAGDSYYAVPFRGLCLYQFRAKSTVIQTARNDANGDVNFDMITIRDAGTYFYQIREVIPPDAGEGMDYDAHTATIRIDIRKDGDKYLKEVSYIGEDGSATMNFINTFRPYTLPATGGSGVIPYLFAGTGIIALSILLIYRRRKEVLDSR